MPTIKRNVSARAYIVLDSPLRNLVTMSCLWCAVTASRPERSWRRRAAACEWSARSSDARRGAAPSIVDPNLDDRHGLDRYVLMTCMPTRRHARDRIDDVHAVDDSTEHGVAVVAAAVI